MGGANIWLGQNLEGSIQWGRGVYSGAGEYTVGRGVYSGAGEYAVGQGSIQWGRGRLFKAQVANPGLAKNFISISAHKLHKFQ